MLSDVRNWIIAGFSIGTVVVFVIVYLVGVSRAANEAVRVRDIEWKNELTARNIKYHNDMMLKDAKVRRREEEIYEQLEQQRLLQVANEKLLTEFAERVPLSDACMHCRVAREYLLVPKPASSTGGSGGAATDSGKGRVVKRKGKGNMPKP